QPAVEARLEVRLGDELLRDAEDASFHFDEHAFPFDADEPTHEGLARSRVFQRPEGLHPDVLAGEALEVFAGAERPVESRARDFELVRSLDGILDVERGGKGAGDLGAI